MSTEDDSVVWGVDRAPAQQEPFGYFQYDIRLDAWVQNRINNKGAAFYTSPTAQRTWVGLTDEEYSQLHDGLYQQGKSLGWVVDQVEAKLKAKNAA